MFHGRKWRQMFWPIKRYFFDKSKVALEFLQHRGSKLKFINLERNYYYFFRFSTGNTIYNRHRCGPFTLILNPLEHLVEEEHHFKIAVIWCGRNDLVLWCGPWFVFNRWNRWTDKSDLNRIQKPQFSSTKTSPGL